MADKNNKVIHYKNRWHGSVIGFLFIFIFIYLAVQLYFFFTKEKISIFEVQEKALYSIATDYKGFITRDEQIVTLKNDAYVNYSVREGLKTAWKHNLYDSGYQCNY